MNKPYNYEDDLANNRKQSKQWQLATIGWLIQALTSTAISFVTTLATLIVVNLIKG